MTAVKHLEPSIIGPMSFCTVSVSCPSMVFPILSLWQWTPWWNCLFPCPFDQYLSFQSTRLASPTQMLRSPVPLYGPHPHFVDSLLSKAHLYLLSECFGFIPPVSSASSTQAKWSFFHAFPTTPTFHLAGFSHPSLLCTSLCWVLSLDLNTVSLIVKWWFPFMYRSPSGVLYKLLGLCGSFPSRSTVIV